MSHEPVVLLQRTRKFGVNWLEGGGTEWDFFVYGWLSVGGTNGAYRAEPSSGLNERRRLGVFGEERE